MARIAYIGNFMPSFSTETHVALSLEELGHEVVRLQEHSTEDVTRIATTHAIDMVLWTRTWGVAGDASQMLRDLSAAQIPTVAYHLDLYAGLARAATVETEPWWRCSLVITADGGSDDFWRQHKINHYWMPPAVYGKECYLAEPYPDLPHDVIFVGSYGYHREWPYRPLLIDNLKARYGDRFTHYPVPGVAIRGDTLNRLYASAKVVVGDSCCIGFNHSRYWSDRVPETLGRGGFLIHPEISGLEREFQYGAHLGTYRFGDWQGLYRTIDYYLDHPDERGAIRRSGHEHVKANHTYVHRMREVIRIALGKETA